MTASIPGATRFDYAGDGATKVFPFPLRFLDAADLRVSLLEPDPVTGHAVEAVKTIGTHFSVTGAGQMSGGAVTFLAAPAGQQTVRLARRTEPRQGVDLTDTTRTPGDTLEAALDRLAMAVQDLDERFAAIATTPGPAGLNGVSTVFFFDGVPDNGYGADGDLAEDRLAGDLYKKIAAAWVFQNSLLGPIGPTGATGPTGPAGAGTGDMLAAQNLNDLANKATAFGVIKQAATTAATGVVELATDAETQTGTDTARAITPANLTAKEASAAQVRSNTADRLLTTDIVYSAAAEVTLTDATTIAVNLSNFINAVVTLGGNRTLGQPSNVKVGQSGWIRIVQDGTGGRTLAYHADWEFAGGVAPSLSTGAGDQDLLFYSVIATGRVFASLVKDIS